MSESGVLQSAKEGAVPGAYAGFTVAAARAFLAAGAPPSPVPAKSSPVSKSLLTSVARSSPLPMIASTTAIYSALGAVYMATTTLARDTRNKDDMWNSVIAGAVAGSLVGIRSSSLYMSAGAAASLASVSALYHIFDGQFGAPKDNRVVQRRKAIYTNQ
ncbi:Outer envelope pore protein 16-3, chloroplastic/mitochondrial [Gracilariopsis chorda]|uniref:Outer envelope pore protein 16-3, chloroplastic/mitochondrial n=1 Tax=Gracilariopsis chorda TaxID=448386 RepID=A0A2V3IKH6_9FLOR|nr:Outer envelope pore protein 16-3, chloroplastic/mitochondrial [Gracilariopsis chorda]|eukprot:PXF42548.1 Outer envelope pore protein 16-3, chloroplastic/mitochondrial [Gracilariopsis chorda]